MEERCELESIEYLVSKGRPTIHLFLRDPEGNRVHRVEWYRPYFFLRKKDYASIESEMRNILSLEEGSISLFDEPLVKLKTNVPSNVALMRDICHSRGIPTYEADTYSFTLRWLLDKNIYYEYPPSNHSYPATLDFESRARVLYLDTEILNGSIICISVSRGETPPLTLTSKHFPSAEPNLRTYSNEKEMLASFFRIFQEIDPDMIIGWNINFDLRNLVSRMRKLGLSPAALSPINKITYSKRGRRKEETEVLLRGREIFDLARGYKEKFKKELSVPIIEALDIVARRHLGQGKLSLNWSQAPEIWKNDPSFMVRYNKRDVELLIELENELGVFDFFNSLRKKAGVRLQDVWYKSRLIDAGLFRTSGKRLPSAKSFPREEGTYSGAHREAQPGIYDNVLLIDFVSFYPAIVARHNISPETLVEAGFKSEPAGIMPILIKKLLGEKKRAKEALRSHPSEKTKLDYMAIKYLTNSAYGQMGYKPSRVYNLECAESITSIAREEIKSLRNLVRQMKYSVPYVDTDSLAIQNVSAEDKDEIVSVLNDNLRGLEVEEAGYFDRMIIVAKTRYVGRTFDGKLEIKGMPLIRSDIPTYFMESQEKLVNSILGGAPREKIVDFVKDRLKNLQNQRIWNLATPKGLRKASLEDYKGSAYHKRAVEKASEILKLKFRAGDKPRIIPIKGREGFLAIKPDTELPRGHQVNLPKLRNDLVRCLSRIYSLLGIKDDEILSDTRQLSLEEFKSRIT